MVVVTMFRMEADVSDRFDAAHFGRALDPARLVIMLARQGHGALAGLLVATMVWRTGSRRNVHSSREFLLTGVWFEHRFPVCECRRLYAEAPGSALRSVHREIESNC